MAKKTGSTQADASTMSAATESRLEEFAEDLGRLLGEAQNKAEGWLNQRKAIAAHLTGVRDTATRLLAELGMGAAPRAAAPRAKKRAAGRAAAKGAGRKKRTLSAEARERIAAAQRARWAKRKKSE